MKSRCLALIGALAAVIVVSLAPMPVAGQASTKTNAGPPKTPWGEPESDENVHLVERFTRVDVNTINYEATVDDPTTWTRPWTLALPMTRSPDQENGILEYACHEGNEGLTGILRGARAHREGRRRGREEEGIEVSRRSLGSVAQKLPMADTPLTRADRAQTPERVEIKES